METKEYEMPSDFGRAMFELRSTFNEHIQEMDQQARRWTEKQEGMIAYWTGQQKANMDHLAGQQQELINQCKDLVDSIKIETKAESWAGRIWNLALVLFIAVPVIALFIVLMPSKKTNQHGPVTEKKLLWIPKQPEELPRLVPDNTEK